MFNVKHIFGTPRPRGGLDPYGDPENRFRASAKPNVSADELKAYYRDMLLIRRFEEKAGQLYGMGLIGGFCHLYIGQEAVVVGLEAAAEEGDKRRHLLPRPHGHMLACGHGPQGCDGRGSTGPRRRHSKGKGGSMHMFSKEETFFYGGHGIVAALRCRSARASPFSDMYKGNDRVTFTYFGGPARPNQGQVAETYNMAELWALPCIFVIEKQPVRHGHER